jgi:hypothetical protein
LQKATIQILEDSIYQQERCWASEDELSEGFELVSGWVDQALIVGVAWAAYVACQGTIFLSCPFDEDGDERGDSSPSTAKSDCGVRVSGLKLEGTRRLKKRK